MGITQILRQAASHPVEKSAQILCTLFCPPVGGFGCGFYALRGQVGDKDQRFNSRQQPLLQGACTGRTVPQQRIILPGTGKLLAQKLYFGGFWHPVDGGGTL